VSAVVSPVHLGTGLSLACAQQGDAVEGPALVLLPGPTDSWRSYAPVLDQLPATIRAVAVSQRGHAGSGKPPDGYAIEDFAADVLPLLDALDIERAFLAGHSGSCLVARRVALDAPDRVAGLVLEASPTSLHGDPGLEGFVTSTVAALSDPIDPELARAFVTDTSSEHLTPEVVDDLVADACEVPAHVWKEMFGSLLAYDDMDEVSRIDAPALLVWGDADGLVDRAMQDELLSRLRSAELAVYAGVGHTPRWEDPARFAADVATFVRASGDGER
jgi:pimeloyl-ACP methyl ester carboxylesterase